MDTHDIIKKSIPHRYENILIDTFTRPETDIKEGSFTLRIQEKDSLNRHLFLKKLNDTKSAYMSTFIMETLALGAILTANTENKKVNAFFACITKFKKEGHFISEQTNNGTCLEKSVKQGFYRYSGRFKNKTAESSGDILAFFTFEEPTQTSSEKKKVTLPTLQTPQPIEPPTYKDPCMFTIDTLVSLDKEKKEMIATYTYPETHPLIKGHFPGNPIMMGVMQWMMIEDACYTFSKLLPNEITKKGTSYIHCNAIIYKKDGTLACEINKATVAIYNNHTDIVNQADIIATHKVLFRDMVYPNDTLFIQLTINDITHEAI
ncbi:hypothetical protein DID77_01350 [Candidatus Marinamargulisbacteria bacterium SCGC AG-439-L15]|nr:hypothetical protein DID77_01350 [Candidatus Marinamargulisbacteria bacterium SCGC AG-439-L15]